LSGYSLRIERSLQTAVFDAIMIGRAAQGRPWFFNEIQHYLQTGEQLIQADLQKIKNTLLQHLEELYLFYFCESLFWASQPKQAAKT
jgi:tRNA-dihydrouridine synthase